MSITFSDQAWEDYLYWQKIDKRLTKKRLPANKTQHKTALTAEQIGAILKDLDIPALISKLTIACG